MNFSSYTNLFYKPKQTNMKKFLILMLMISSLASYAQKTNLITVNTVKPMKGQKMAFEAAYKQFTLAKFHKAIGKCKCVRDHERTLMQGLTI